ncbi:hypothetical protein ER308_03995 [Egibacter rhizosphaerae]|uniref:BAAT/Acyl-CoA thioester hydrolase C-terminal domain-containing protein n=1 Tax=Egibacter rhizosphaerae TaxID=1670831 RepID=A0A411YC14_9ACTN|nr:acyl-CoA thioester hydrolase/BAAT C-terminal domain-containing protein [Egibacter rhizosphaerae]QBI18793.1 hypothetical protein ER308_03995 [Egibacter rhizosphaerae]
MTDMEVTSQRVDTHGLVGVLCAPRAPGPAPGVLLLGGSEGGLHERDARALASEGFSALALAYFGASSLPPGLVDIPLEYFFRALDVLAAQPASGERFGVAGGSRGAEAALLTAAHDERVAAVVSVVGSGVVTQGIDFRQGNLLDILRTPTNSWTLDGQALPYLPNVVSDELGDLIQRGVPVPLSLAYPVLPSDPGLLEQVNIKVENIAGAALFICAEDDRMWPSREYTQVAIDRLSAHPYPVEHKTLRGAGHPIAGPPSTPFTTTTSPGPGVTFEMGGTTAANTGARASAWQATVRFLKDHLA